MPLFLITNDDGIQSPGLDALVQALSSQAECMVIAPDRDNSAVSHSLTMNRPLRVTKLRDGFYTVDGTPTDCVAIGLNKIIKQKPDMLISGINPGPNLGDDISYSGTVSAAVEGTMYGIPSLAVSLAGEAPYDFSRAAQLAVKLTKLILKQGLPQDTLLNANVPASNSIKGIKITRQGRRLWDNAIQETLDPWGRKHYWIGGGTPSPAQGEDTDVYAVNNGYISVTPIHLDLTNHQGIDHLKKEWHLEED
ncbi:MAG: 5'/3'-nucleotidase SurE [Desulfocapsa sp.]|nr:5'/3'-nucleotidase SurE [Desulfocapsa sp.]